MKFFRYINLHQILYVCFVIALLSCKEEQLEESSAKTSTNIDRYIQHLQHRHGIPGIALAIQKGDRILYKKTFGKASIEHNSPITGASIFRIYSLTKPIVSVGIFQLIEQGKLSLEDRIDTYVKDIPTSWKGIQVKHLLTHSSGLPDMAPYARMEKLTEQEAKELVFKKDKNATGVEYSYNQTNFWLLQLIIEKISGVSLENFIIKGQFEGFEKEVFFSSNSKVIIPNRVTGYFPFETGTIQISHPSLKGRYMFAANGLNITMDAFLAWNHKLNNNELLQKETKEQMWATFSYSGSDKIFSYGWDKRTINGHDSYGFSGSLVTAYRIFPNDDISIVFLSNGLGNYYNIDNIVNHIASLVDTDIVDTANEAFEALLQKIVDHEIDAMRKEYMVLKEQKKYESLNFEALVNDVGYQLINQKRIEKAIEVFTFNTKQFPKSANAFDSLGEAYYRNHQDELAIEQYQKAIDLGGTNGNAKKMLAQIKK
jgi:CubicO group peptidase (beta-lactamase class C family)